MRQRGGMVAVAVAVLVAGYFLRIGFFTYALYVVLGLLLISRLTGERPLDRVHCQRYCAVDRAQLGASIPVRVAVHYQGWLPLPWLVVDDLVPEALAVDGTAAQVVSLFSQQRLTFGYTLTATRRGYHQIGPTLLESGDLFGLARRFVAADQPHYVTVHPEVVPIADYDLASPHPVGEVRAGQRIFEDTSRLRGVREFQPGDKLSRIHWRATALTGTLQTKVFEPSTMVGAALCLDLYEPAYAGVAVTDRSELGVVVAASLASYIAAAGQRVGFLSNGRDAADRARYDAVEVDQANRWRALRQARMREQSDRLRPVEVQCGRGPEALQQILDATARVELSDFQSVGAMLLREYPRLPRDVSLVVITPRIDDDLRRALAAMRQSGFTLTTVVLAVDPAQAAASGELLAGGVPSYAVSNKHQLRQLAAVRL